MSFPKLWFRNKLTAVEPKATAAVLDGGVAVAAEVDGVDSVDVVAVEVIKVIGYF